MSAYISEGYFIKYGTDGEQRSDYRHSFCGQNTIIGASCPNCVKPLLLFMSVDMSDSRLKNYATSRSIIPLLYCWTCNISQSEFYYKLISDHEIEILLYEKGKKYVDFPYASYPEYFPLAEMDLIAINDIEQTIIHKLNSNEINQYLDLKLELQYLTEPSHQIGGEPYLVQKELEKVHCCLCNAPMHFFASVANNCTDRRGFVGNDYVQVIFYFCKTCDVLCAIQMCD